VIEQDEIGLKIAPYDGIKDWLKKNKRDENNEVEYGLYGDFLPKNIPYMVIANAIHYNQQRFCKTVIDAKSKFHNCTLKLVYNGGILLRIRVGMI